jgi:formate hydrogenlyase subunit 6/NADH:ubiquinone oxidoreductase subunit I
MRQQPGKIFPVALKQLFSKPATAAYPVGGKEQFPTVRGRIVFDPDSCVGCTACMRDCPTGAITINKVGEKQYKAVIDIDVCIFCSQCVTTCPRGSLIASPDFELAVLNRGALKDRCEQDEGAA